MAENSNDSSKHTEWKRYKPFTKNDLSKALEAVRLGMTTSQAARTYGVLSRTLYSEAKKLGIVGGGSIRSSTTTTVTDSTFATKENENSLEDEFSSDKSDSAPGASFVQPNRCQPDDDIQISLEAIHVGEYSQRTENNSNPEHGIAGNSSGSSHNAGWVQYKEHTENDMLEAIDAICTGMNVLEAARKHGVPSRTLKDKAKMFGVYHKSARIARVSPNKGNAKKGKSDNTDSNTACGP